MSEISLKLKRSEPFAILIADDSPVNQKMMSQYLCNLIGKDKVQIITADNGAIAVKETKENHFDLIIMDCDMPVLNGPDATLAIREYEKESYMTAWTANEEIKEPYEKANALLKKPTKKEAVKTMLLNTGFFIEMFETEVMSSSPRFFPKKHKAEASCDDEHLSKTPRLGLAC